MPIAEHSRKKLPDSISIIQILILTVKCQPFRLLSLISEQNAYAVRLKCIFMIIVTMMAMMIIHKPLFTEINGRK